MQGQPGTLTPWRGPGEQVVSGWGAVAYPGVVVAEAGSRVCAVDGGLAIALEGSRVWAWDGGLVHAKAGSRVDAGPYGRVDAEAGAHVSAEQARGLGNEESWPHVVSRGARVFAEGAVVEADEGSQVVVWYRARLILHGRVLLETNEGRGVLVTYSDQPMPPLLAPAPSRLAGRPVLPAEPMSWPGEPASELGPPQSVVDWLEPLLDVLRAQGVRVADQWTPTLRGPQRLLAGRISSRKVAQLLAVPPTLVPAGSGEGSVDGYGSNQGVSLLRGRVPRRWLWR